MSCKCKFPPKVFANLRQRIEASPVCRERSLGQSDDKPYPDDGVLRSLVSTTQASLFWFLKTLFVTSLAVQWLRICLPRMWVQFLVGEPMCRFYMLYGMVKKKKYDC